MFLLILLFLSTLFLLSNIHGVLSNRRKALRLGLPYVIVPVSEFNLLHQILFPLSLRIAKLLGVDQQNWFRCATPISRVWQAKASLHEDPNGAGVGGSGGGGLGNVFAVVSPGSFSINAADADFVYEAMKCKRILKPVWSYRPLAAFGPNILSTSAEEWQFHRRVTAPPFNARVNGTVWDESCRLALELLSEWTSPLPSSSSPSPGSPSSPSSPLSSSPSPPTPIVSDPQRGITTLTLRTLSSAIFGIKLRSSASSSENPQEHQNHATTTSTNHATFSAECDRTFARVDAPAAGYTLTYRDAITHLFQNLYHVILFPHSLLRLGPASWKRSHAAFTDVQRYLRLVLERTRRDHNDNSHGGAVKSERENLVEALCRNSLDQARENSKKPPGGGGAARLLTETELLGNAFILTIAGYDGVSRALEYGVLSLAIDPGQQERLLRYLDDALGEYRDVDVREWVFEDVYDRLVCLEWVALETLRMFPPAVMLPREPTAAGETLTYNGRAYHFPPNTTITMRTAALQYHKAYWGSDADEFRFERWRDPTTTSTSTTTTSHSLKKMAGTIEPRKGTYLAFGDGFRACLGRRFALVEIAAVLAVLFRRHRVELALLPGEAWEDARDRAVKAIAGSTSIFSLMVGGKVPLRWVPR